MSLEQADPRQGGQPVRILEETEDYHYKRFKIRRARLQYRRSDGQMSEAVTRLNFERGNSAAVLLHDPQQDTVMLVKQFRYPVYAGLPPAERDAAEGAWLLEIIAGVQEVGQSMAEVARREAEEEAGFRVQGQMEPVCEVYLSPGGSSERVAIFLAEIDAAGRTGPGGGLQLEGEDTELVSLPFAQAMGMLSRGEISDAKTAIALQYLALKQAQRQASPPHG